jgi:hypothetical protein
MARLGAKDVEERGGLCRRVEVEVKHDLVVVVDRTEDPVATHPRTLPSAGVLVESALHRPYSRTSSSTRRVAIDFLLSFQDQVGRGWTGEQYERWLADAFCSQLLDGRTAPAG